MWCRMSWALDVEGRREGIGVWFGAVRPSSGSRAPSNASTSIVNCAARVEGAPAVLGRDGAAGVDPVSASNATRVLLVVRDAATADPGRFCETDTDCRCVVPKEKLNGLRLPRCIRRPDDASAGLDARRRCDCSVLGRPLELLCARGRRERSRKACALCEALRRASRLAVVATTAGLLSGKPCASSCCTMSEWYLPSCAAACCAARAADVYGSAIS